MTDTTALIPGQFNNSAPIVPPAVKPPITPPAPAAPPNPIVPPNPATPPSYDKVTGARTDYGKSTGAPDMLGGKPVAPPVPTPTSTPPGSPTPEQTDTLNNAQEGKDALSKQYDDAYDSFKTTMGGYLNGSIPLTPGEQAQVEGLKQQYQQLIDAQKLTNTNASGIANIRGYQTGAAQYDPTFQVKTIGSIVTAGAQKVATLNTQMASAVAALTQSFKTNDMAAIKSAYDEYKDYEKQKSDSLQKTIDDTTAAIKTAFDQAEEKKKDDLAALVHSDTVSYQDKQLAIDAAQLDETTRHNMATELIQNQANGGGSTGGTMPAVPMNANGTVNTQAQATFLQGLPTDLAALVKGIANYDINPSSIATKNYKGVGGLNQSQVLSLVAQYDPSFSQSDYAVRQAYKKSLASNTSGSVGGAINSANKATNHLTAFVDDMSKLGNSWSSTENAFANATVNKLTSGTRQALKAATTEGIGVADELAKFFKGSGSTDIQSITDWKNQLSVNASPADVQGLVQGAITLLVGQLETLSEQYKSTMGKAPDNNLLGPSALGNLQNLKNQGYTVDIPGVNYTNKDSYLKYGGGTPDQLISAHDYLVNLNDPANPPTPENALELAQLLNQ